MRYDKEINIVDDLADLDKKEILILSDNENSVNYKKCERIINNLLTKTNWIDNSNSQFPPDFINEKEKIMMELMRTDDHVLHKKKNLYRQQERETHKFLEDIVLKINPDFNTDNIIVNPITNIKTEEDHSYTAYLSNFTNTIKKHINKIENYRKNYRNYDLCFFLMDESSGIYAEKKVCFENYRSGFPRVFFADEAFVKQFISQDLEYFIWYAPYKYAQLYGKEIFDLPKLVIFDLKHIGKNKKFRLIKYKIDKMISSEK